MKHEMSSAINQMQMLYNPEEDRILFRVNTSDNKEFSPGQGKASTLFLIDR
jgi:hypothetical protein